MFKLTRAMASSPDNCEQIPSNAAMPVPIVPIITPNNPESHPVTHLPTMPVATIEVPNTDTKEPPTVSHSELHSFPLSVSTRATGSNVLSLPASDTTAGPDQTTKLTTHQIRRLSIEQQMCGILRID